MTFSCDKCAKVFVREEHLTRHKGRKIPCNRDLKCNRCFKEFTQISHLKNHMSRKFLCNDKRTDSSIALQIEIEKTKQKEAKVKLEIEKTKQEEAKAKQKQEETKQKEIALKQTQLDNKISITNNSNNTTNNITNNYIFPDNIINIDKQSLVVPSLYTALSLIVVNNINESIKNMYKHQFNNDAHPNNKAMIVLNEKVYCKIYDKTTELKDGRISLNKYITDICVLINNFYSQLSDEEIYQYGLSGKRNEVLPDEYIKTLNKILKAISNLHEKPMENIVKEAIQIDNQKIEN
jgi:hypothetical protein